MNTIPCRLVLKSTGKCVGHATAKVSSLEKIEDMSDILLVSKSQKRPPVICKSEIINHDNQHSANDLQNRFSDVNDCIDANASNDIRRMNRSTSSVICSVSSGDIGNRENPIINMVKCKDSENVMLTSIVKIEESLESKEFIKVETSIEDTANDENSLIGEKTGGGCLQESSIESGKSVSSGKSTGSEAIAVVSQSNLHSSLGLIQGSSSFQKCQNIKDENAEPGVKTSFNSSGNDLVTGEVKTEADEVKIETEGASFFTTMTTPLTNKGLFDSSFGAIGMGGRGTSIFDQFFLDTVEENDLSYITRKNRRVQCKLCIESGVTTMVMIKERSRHMRRRHLPEEECDDCGKMFRPIDMFHHKRKCNTLV